jgi:hypothetical protein
MSSSTVSTAKTQKPQQGDSVPSRTTCYRMLVFPETHDLPSFKTFIIVYDVRLIYYFLLYQLQCGGVKLPASLVFWWVYFPIVNTSHALTRLVPGILSLNTAGFH